jgi:hypothetical protein
VVALPRILERVDRRKLSKTTGVPKEAAREYVRQRVIAALGPLVDAQIQNATGLKYLVTRDKKTGKFIRVGAAMAGRAGEETIEVWEQDPAVQAFTDLLNRALDKPAEYVEMTVRKLQETSDEELLNQLAQLTEKLRRS